MKISGTAGVVALALAFLVVAASPAGAVERHVFATSVTGTGNLGSWPDAGAATGLAAGDAICRARATAAGLANATSYRAWLSTSVTDAYCHVRSQTGKKASGCAGGPPNAAGPWFLVGGFSPFADELDQAVGTARRVFQPVFFDENGNPLAGLEREYWTGTYASGEVAGDWTCANWTSSSAPSGGSSGNALAAAVSWTSYMGGRDCATPARLLCLEPGQSEPVVLPQWLPSSLVFLTSAQGNGNLHDWPAAQANVGLAAGDRICRTLAASAHLPAASSYVAWLSGETLDAADRMTSPGPFRRVDGFPLAFTRADFLDGYLINSIHVRENGSYDGGATWVWTGTDEAGLATGSACSDWTTAVTTEHGTDGFAAEAYSPGWTDHADPNCAWPAQLLCVSNAVVVFWDGFDFTHDTSRWSATVP